MILHASPSRWSRRLVAMGILMAAGMMLLVLGLVRVQLLRGGHYTEREAQQSLRRIRIPAVRGEIHDRNGVVLARNRPSYDVAIYLEQLTGASKRRDVVQAARHTLQALSQSVNKPVGLTERDVRIHYAVRRPMPLTVWRDLGTSELAAFAERAAILPAVDLIVNPVREYPLATAAAHVVGYVNRDRPASDVDALEQYYYYQPDLVGKQGVERTWDAWLRGEPGGRTIRVGPSGATVEVVAEKPPQRGHTVVLTLDARIQRLAEEAFTSAPVGERPLRGAVVVMDVTNGEVLALVSWPAFDPNLFNPGRPAGQVEALFQDAARPLFNRAIGGLYAPGSTFKPVTLLAALESGRGRLNEISHCSGALTVGNRSFGCWRREGHGPVDGLTAMRVSCDVWFYQRGLATGVDNIERVARWFGLGQPTGVDVGIEPAGLVPTPAWKRRERGDRWWDGDTAQLAIGQSFLLATPMQMTVMAAALANGGTVWRPFVVKRVLSPTGAVVQETRPQVRWRVPASTTHFEWVRRSLWDAVRLPDGTAHRATVPGVSVAGKTGTAEFDLYEDGQRRRINRAWFIGFAPYEQPRYAVTVLVEEAVSGGHTAAPVAGRIFAGLFGRQYAAVSGGGGD